MSNIITNTIDSKFKNIIVTDVELKNGKKTQIVTVFNNEDLFFEEVNSGVINGLKKTYDCKSATSHYSRIKEGSLEHCTTFEKHNF